MSKIEELNKQIEKANRELGYFKAIGKVIDMARGLKVNDGKISQIELIKGIDKLNKGHYEQI